MSLAALFYKLMALAFLICSYEMQFFFEGPEYPRLIYDALGFWSCLYFEFVIRVFSADFDFPMNVSKRMKQLKAQDKVLRLRIELGGRLGFRYVFDVVDDKTNPDDRFLFSSSQHASAYYLLVW